MKHRRGFTLIEVLAAFIIALVLLAPIANMIGGVAGALVGLDRSAARRGELHAAAAAASLAPRAAGSYRIGDYQVVVRPYKHGRERELTAAGWRLFSIEVESSSAASPVVQTLGMGRF